MNATNKLREQAQASFVDTFYKFVGDFAVVGGELYAIERARCGIGVDHSSGKPKVLYKTAETLIRLIPPEA